MPASPKSNKLNRSRTTPRATAPFPSVAPLPPVPAPAAVPSSPVPIPPAPDGRCQHLRAEGKRCASLNYPGHTALCHHHLNREMRGIATGNIIAADILSSIGNFQSASAINITLGKIFLHQITGRINRQDARALAYHCQLLLQTLPAVKAEINEAGYNKYWHDETRRILSGPADLDRITDSSLLPNGCDPLHPPTRTPAPSPAPTPPAAPPSPAHQPASNPASSTSSSTTPSTSSPAVPVPPASASAPAPSTAAESPAHPRLAASPPITAPANPQLSYWDTLASTSRT